MVLIFQIGKVMRIRKAPRSGAEAMTMRSPSALTAQERLLWKDVHELISSPDNDIASQQFVHHVMKPLLGSKFVDAGVCVELCCPPNPRHSVGIDFVIYKCTTQRFLIVR